MPVNLGGSSQEPPFAGCEAVDSLLANDKGLWLAIDGGDSKLATARQIDCLPESYRPSAVCPDRSNSISRNVLRFFAVEISSHPVGRWRAIRGISSRWPTYWQNAKKTPPVAWS